MENTIIKSAQEKIDTCWHLLVLCAVGMGISMIPDAVFAAGGSNAIQTVFCNVISMLTSTTGRAIATVAIIAVGIGALLGKISWGMALIVAIGVALIFGAGSIVTALGASAGTGTCASGSFSNQ